MRQPSWQTVDMRAANWFLARKLCTRKTGLKVLDFCINSRLLSIATISNFVCIRFFLFHPTDPVGIAIFGVCHVFRNNKNTQL